MNAPPPDFLAARNRRQKARAAGLHPDYWYAVEYDRAVRPGQVLETRFWNTSIAIYRGEDGGLRALENRCAHRQIKLSLGQVDGTTSRAPTTAGAMTARGGSRGSPTISAGGPCPL